MFLITLCKEEDLLKSSYQLWNFLVLSNHQRWVYLSLLIFLCEVSFKFKCVVSFSIVQPFACGSRRFAKRLYVSFTWCNQRVTHDRNFFFSCFYICSLRESGKNWINLFLKQWEIDSNGKWTCFSLWSLLFY